MNAESIMGFQLRDMLILGWIDGSTWDHVIGGALCCAAVWLLILAVKKDRYRFSLALLAGALLGLASSFFFQPTGCFPMRRRYMNVQPASNQVERTHVKRDKAPRTLNHQ